MAKDSHHNPPRSGGPPWQLWTLSQRRVLVALLLFLGLLLAWRAWHRPLYLPDPAGRGFLADQLPGRLDPNQATAEAFTALPGLGPARAQAIVVYRQQFLLDHPDELAFRQPVDLQNVPGLGPATVETLLPYLLFPSDSP